MMTGILTLSSCFAQSDYDRYFTDAKLRLDLVFAGNNSSEQVFLNQLVAEDVWAGTRTQLVDPFGYGEFRFEAYDAASGKKIFTNGFSTLFSEWQTTEESHRVNKAMNVSLSMPYPKDKVKVRVTRRQFEDGSYKEIFNCEIDPADKLIKRGKANNFEVVDVMINGESKNKVDLLFVAEGYTADEMDKFMADVNKFMGYLFDIEPYKHRKNDFNIRAVKSVSEESGPDFPHKDIWKNTVLNSHFYTFETDRYLTAPDQTLVSSVASVAPYDAIYVIVNTKTYGGGGIYNYYGLSMSDHHWEATVFVHEFGHSFAGLADEYFDSDVAYEDFYNLKLEPWEPNITTQVNFDAKWKDMMGKDGVDLWEGGGYMAKGIWRPVDMCKMRVNTVGTFCPVCVRAIEKMIDYYCK